MKNILTQKTPQQATDLALLITRVGVAALMLTHGIPKMVMLFSDAPVQFPAVFGLNPSMALALTVFAEVFCSILLLAGFATRLAAIPLAFTMLTAALLIHANDPIGIREPALQYLLVYLVLLFAGSGRYSVDHLLQSRKMKPVYVSRETEDPTLLMYR